MSYIKKQKGRVLILFALFILGVSSVLWGVLGLGEEKSKEPSLYKKTLMEEGSRVIYGVSCSESYSGFGFGEEAYNQETIEVIEIIESGCKKFRETELLKWQAVIDQSDNPAEIARALTYRASLFYADAYDLKDLESGKLAVQALEASFSREPLFPDRGIDEFSAFRHELLEMAQAKVDELTKKEEEKKREEEAQRAAQVPSSLKQDEDKKEAKEGRIEIDGVEILIVEPGTNP